MHFTNFPPTPQVVLTEGPYAGQQAIIIRPAKAFRFLELEVEIRTRIYGYYFAQKGVMGDSIVIDGKRSNDTKDMYAKTYAEGSKFRVSLLAVNKEVRSPHAHLQLHSHKQDH